MLDSLFCTPETENLLLNTLTSVALHQRCLMMVIDFILKFEIKVKDSYIFLFPISPIFPFKLFNSWTKCQYCPQPKHIMGKQDKQQYTPNGTT